jgi:nucleotide-binding universal stress UspA family protein
MTHHHLIVGYNGADGSADALALALAVADATPERQVELTVASVYPFDTLPSRGAPEGYREALEEDAERRLDDARATCGDRPGVDFVVRGATSPAHGLHLLADELDAEAIVVGRSHTGAVGRAFVGSVTEQTLHGAPRPVFVAPVGYAAGARAIETVGVAFDGSAEAQRAVAFAAGLARGAGAGLRIVETVQALPATYGGFVVDPYSLEDRRADAQATVDAARSSVEGVPTEGRVLAGDPVHVFAQPDQAVDLLVLGSRNFGPVKRVLLGSVSSRMVRSCPVPLVVIPRSAATETADAADAARAQPVAG